MGNKVKAAWRSKLTSLQVKTILARVADAKKRNLSNHEKSEIWREIYEKYGITRNDFMKMRTSEEGKS